MPAVVLIVVGNIGRGDGKRKSQAVALISDGFLTGWATVGWGRATLTGCKSVIVAPNICVVDIYIVHFGVKIGIIETSVLSKLVHDIVFYDFSAYCIPGPSCQQPT